MKHKWIAKNNNKSLILFFNGWGMDGGICRILNSKNSDDFLMFYDYKDLTLPVALDELCELYEKTTLIAWSFGVWVAEKVLSQKDIKFSHKIALNGTGKPIDSEYGIPPEIYQATLDTYSQKTKIKFRRRMCADRNTFKQFTPFVSQRNAEDQKEELKLLQQYIVADYAINRGNFYDDAIIGNKDKIIPSKNQINYWKKNKTKYSLLNAPHIPFFCWNNWNDLEEHKK